MEDFLRALVERRVFLDAEVVAGHVQRDVRHVADRRDVAGAVPRGLDAEDARPGCAILRAGVKPPACETWTRM